MKKSISKLPTVTIGIPAYNEEGNIANLLRSILKQREKIFRLEKIYVICDGCSDRTGEEVLKIAGKDKRIILIDDKKRVGKTTRLNQLHRLNKSDLIFNLDGDVYLERVTEVEEMVKIFLEDPKALVVAAHQEPIRPPGLIGSISYVNSLLWNETRVNINGGDHIANLYGSASMLRKSFAKNLHFPTHITCDEEFLYVMAKKRNGFRYSPTNRIRCWSVGTLSDLLSQSVRFSKERYVLSRYFGPDVTKLHYVPLKYKIHAVKVMLKRYPFYTVLAVIFNSILPMIPAEDKLNKNGMWMQAKSTKVAVKL